MFPSYKLPYIGFYSSYTRKNISCIISKYCKNLNVKVIFSPFKLCNNFSPKDFVADFLKSRVVHKFTCAGCGARYVGETNRHFYTREIEHPFRDKNTHIFKNRSFSKNSQENFDVSCFKIIDNATSFYLLKIKKSFHIERLKPELNKQVDHVSLALHFYRYVSCVLYNIAGWFEFYLLVTNISSTKNHYIDSYIYIYIDE